MQPDRGTVVVAGRVVPVTRLAFGSGMLQITAQVRAAHYWPAVADVPAAVFGADGKGVCQGWLITIPEVRAGESVTILLPIRIDSLKLEKPPG